MKYLILVLVSLALSTVAAAEIQTREVIYTADGANLTGFMAWDDAIAGQRPGVLVVHEWWGHNDYARKRARDLAELGYVGFALDMYGDNKLAAHPEDASKFMGEIMKRYDGMKARFDAAKQQLLSSDLVDGKRVAAIGYCFGGGVVLNMARANAQLSAVVSFHGSLNAVVTPEKTINVPMLVLNGADDPYVPEDAIGAFKAEMTAANADYEFINYPNTKHSFTNPGATEVGKKFDMPLVYNAEADKQSWQAMRDFLARAFQ